MRITIETEYPEKLNLTNAEYVARAFAEAGLNRPDYLVNFDSFNHNDFGAVCVKIVATRRKPVIKK